MAKFNDPYTRYIPKKQMSTKQQQIRGETVGIGNRSIHSQLSS
jgi:C-terminal processing protease CtpA/Prc